MNNEVNLLKEIIEFGHNWTKKYLNLLKDTDPYRNFEINGIQINNLYWLTAHLTYVEDVLLSRALGFEKSQYKWLSKFGIRSNSNQKGKVSYLELTKIAQEIHLKCMNNLNKLTDNDLGKDNYLKLKFGNDQSIKVAIKHHIRHQSLHSGHLSTLCKLNGIKTF